MITLVINNLEKNQNQPEALEDMISCANDFPGKAHALVRWYGLREFLIICPAGNTDAIDSEDKAKLLLR